MLYFFIFFFLFHFPAEFFTRYFSLETSTIDLKLQHNVQNGHDGRC